MKHPGMQYRERMQELSSLLASAKLNHIGATGDVDRARRDLEHKLEEQKKAWALFQEVEQLFGTLVDLPAINQDGLHPSYTPANTEAWTKQLAELRKRIP